QSCRQSIRGEHLPHRVLKDNDLQGKLQLAPSTAQAIVTQLAQDSDFLRDQGITDYSLLLSVHTAQFRSPSGASFYRSCRYSIHDDEDMRVTRPLASSYRKSSLDFGTFNNVTSHHDVAASLWTGSRDGITPGIKASAVVGPDFYTMGIIDLLQTWTWQKRVERWWKVFVLRLDGRGISAAPPALYATRFQAKMRNLMLSIDGDHQLDARRQIGHVEVDARIETL
ncbi:hypothetical protein DYB32_007847, partial [Aphanomyces invadans]